MADNNSNKRERERDPIVPALNLSGINQQSYGGGGTTDLDTDRLKESNNSKQSRCQKNTRHVIHANFSRQFSLASSGHILFC